MTDIECKDYIQEQFSGIGISLNDQQSEQFYTYYQMLVEKNQVMNLTAITEFHEVVEKHFLDSCMYAEKFICGNGKGIRLIDIGTGAGFPGIPLKILYPDLSVTLLDSLNKRLNWLNEVISALGLRGIETVHSRAEDGARNPLLREKFDLGVARAVANMATLSEYCLPYVKTGGMFTAYKADAAEEVKEAEKAISLLGGKLTEMVSAQLPISGGKRTLVIISKERQTPKKYPRKAGVPSKEPLH